jgi:predicted DNA-binding transcriptional regulator YafY
MKKIERILGIIVLLLENDRVSTAQLADRFAVTKRTIFRDIETIELAGFPIVSYPGRMGGFSLMDSFKLRTYTYSSEEKQAIIHALAVKEGLFGIYDQQNTIKEKMELLQQLTSADTTISHQFSFDSPTMHRPEIEQQTKSKINQINVALKNHQKIQIDYVDNNGDQTKRLIHPYEVMLMNGSWYIYSYCEVRADFRYFKITRIRQILIQQMKFAPVEYCNKKTVKVDEELIHLRFKKENLGKLYDYYTENEMEVTDAYIEVKIYLDDPPKILPFIMMFGNSVTVITPIDLQKRHKQEIHKLMDIY